MLQDLGSFPHWTLDAHIFCAAAGEPPCAVIGLSNNSIRVFRAHAAGGALQACWAARCSQELLLYSLALHVVQTVRLLLGML